MLKVTQTLNWYIHVLHSWFYLCFLFTTATSTCRLKLTVEGVVDSEEHVQRLKILVDEINAVSHIKVISVERQCIEFIVDINNMYLKDKCLLLEEVTVFYTTLKEKKAFKWKGNTVTIIITIDEGNSYFNSFFTFYLFIYLWFRKFIT